MIEPPTENELHLLHELIDPLSVRQLETLPASARRNKLREILCHEAATFAATKKPQA